MGDQQFPRSARLTRARDFERVLKSPQLRVSAGPLRLQAVFNRMQGARLGLVVGKRAVPRAYARNRIKRIIRDRFRCARAQLPALDIVVRVAGPVTASGLHAELDRLFAQLARKGRDADPIRNTGMRQHGD